MVQMLVGTVMGGLGGYAWYSWVGCLTGACWITADPVLSTGYFAAVGWVLSGGAKVLRRRLDTLR